MGRLLLTDEYRAKLTKWFAETRTEVLAREMGVSYRTLCRWAAELGLEKSREFRTGISAVAKKEFMRRYADKQTERTTMLDADKEVYMKQYFATTPNKVLARIFGVNDRTVRRWAARLGLTKDSEVMQLHRLSKMLPTPEQWFQTVCTIRELYPDGRDDEASERTGYSPSYIGKIAKTYGICRSEAYLQEAREKRKAARIRVNSEAKADRRWVRPRTLEMEASVRDLYADMPTAELAKQLGISEIYVQVLAHRCGIRKSKEFMEGVRSRKKKEQ